MAQRRERSIPELRRRGGICAAVAAGLVIGLLVWPRYAHDRVLAALAGDLSSRSTFALDVFRDPETGRYWIWDQPTGLVFVPQNDAQRAGEAALRETRELVARGELDQPARYVIQFNSAYGPELPWSSVPLWIRRDIRAWFEEHQSDGSQVDSQSRAMSSTVPEPSQGLSASGHAAFKGAYSYWFPEYAAEIDRIGVGGVERSGMLVGIGYQLALMLNAALICVLAFLAGRSWLRASRLAAHGTGRGLCPRCGYPVTTAEQTRCSECGKELTISAA